MKVKARQVFWLFAMVVVVGMDSVLGDDDIAEIGCKVEVPNGMPNIRNVLEANASACKSYNDWVIFRDSRDANTTEDFRLAIKKSCGQAATFTHCLAAPKADARQCLNEFERTTFLLRVGLMETEFEVLCLEGGVRFATISTELKTYYDSQFQATEDVFTSCRRITAKQVTLEPNTTEDPNHDMKYKYRLLKESRQCLERGRGQGQDSLVEAGLGYWGDAMDRMKCVDALGGAEVLCRDIIRD